ncbi:hypothetical protein L1987_56576 [Smallanthus sonchifolius]|uniref:Uncharacterized protein n=1 Tax=Smallanthus sonchifolius TaxID=185202 RepID=A0ACB9EDT0_9ASTR|nr:hypothetical protein L1987_56576 [Smallanthus sonchifolius]
MGLRIMNSGSHPLHLCHLKKSTLIINRLYILFHSIALILLFSFRISSILTLFHSKNQPFIPHLLIFISELTLSFIWIHSQSFLWRPVTRTVFPERLPGDDQLPPIDVFICTADPRAEPPLGVMNTVISAMALNYPAEKLSVYLSDDGGCPVTLEAMREALKFAKMWVPFCNKYGVKTICPEAYFTGREVDDEVMVDSLEFGAEQRRIKEEYESFAHKVTKISESESFISNKDHSPVVEVMVDESTNDERKIPLLVYVSREKRPSHPHHFKAGALNALLRVSNLLSNSPYILGLDCDMYCNDKNSARQAMCFHLDPNLSPSLAFVQFPQTFHNISKHDIYESTLRCLFTTLWCGMDGIKGPCLSGTCYYLKREALYELPLIREDINLKELKQCFGSSNEFIRSLYKKYNAKLDGEKDLFDESLQETKHLASCEYEDGTKWGNEVGFRYFSVTEDFITSITIHCKHWFSVYYMPSRPSFMGSCTTNLNDLLIQGTRWTAGLMEVGLSRFCPLIYGPSRMPILQSFCYAWLALYPIGFISLWILATIPPLSLLNDITVYPKVTNPFFLVFLYVFVLSNLQHMREIHSTGASLLTWKHEQRVWMMKAITSYLYGSTHAVMEKLGVKEANFLPTNKVINEDEVKLHQMGIYNFQTSSMFLVPLCSLVTLNLLGFVVGIIRMVFHKECIDEILVQTFLAFYVALMVGYPVLEGMMLRKDKGRITPTVSCYSLIFSVFILSFGKLLVTY